MGGTRCEEGSDWGAEDQRDVPEPDVAEDDSGVDSKPVQDPASVPSLASLEVVREDEPYRECDQEPNKIGSPEEEGARQQILPIRIVFDHADL